MINNFRTSLYHKTVKFNHSCYPNAILVHSNNDMSVKIFAIENIKKGDEICISYLKNLLLPTKRRYFFILKK